MDYAAAALQPVANGLLTIVGGVPVLTGRGFDGATGVVRGAFANGDFIVTLDIGDLALDPVSTGLPGDVGLDPHFGRVHLTMRGIGAPPATRLARNSYAFISTTQFEVALRDTAGNLQDPVLPFASGVEILVFRASPAPDNVTAQLFGPAYQPAMAFP